MSTETILFLALVLSILGHFVHCLCLSIKIPKWAQRNLPANFEKTLSRQNILTQMYVVGFAYSFVTLGCYFFPNDLWRVFVIFPQGMIICNMFIHVVGYFLWSKQMPCLPSAILMAIPATPIVLLCAQDLGWLSAYFMAELVFWGFVLECIMITLPILLVYQYHHVREVEAPKEWTSF